MLNLNVEKEDNNKKIEKIENYVNKYFQSNVTVDLKHKKYVLPDPNPDDNDLRKLFKQVDGLPNGLEYTKKLTKPKKVTGFQLFKKENFTYCENDYPDEDKKTINKKNHCPKCQMTTRVIQFTLIFK